MTIRDPMPVYMNAPVKKKEKNLKMNVFSLNRQAWDKVWASLFVPHEQQDWGEKIRAIGW